MRRSSGRTGRLPLPGEAPAPCAVSLAPGSGGRVVAAVGADPLPLCQQGPPCASSFHMQTLICALTPAAEPVVPVPPARQARDNAVR